MLILVDDVGFGTTSTFGGPVNTPSFSALAQDGVKYNNFHVNALCSPSRASLLTGRNNHEVGFGDGAEWALPYPGYTTLLPNNITPLAAVLQANGYSTAAFGKWHNTPYWQVSAAGPFDRWPTGRWGFDYFYGFLGGWDNQYFPRLYRDHTPVEPPATPEQGYNLTADLASDAVTWLHQHDAVAHDKPFFIYFATGATHEPHQVPASWIVRYRGRFDKGWDRIREETFEQQKKLGVIPQDAELTPRPADLPAWNSLSPRQQLLFAHQAEVYAAFTEQADHEIGRVLDAVREEGLAGNTVVVEIFGDNGASGEGGLEGRDARDVVGHARSLRERLADAAMFGSEAYMNHFAAAWAWALSSPFAGTKQDASHLGGITDPLVISWPGHVRKVKVIRRQFAHLVDIAPTLYDIAGVRPPTRAVDGEAELPLEGTSFVDTFARADAPSRHLVQYFSTSGNRGIYADGWWAGNLSLNSWDKGWPVFLEQGQEPRNHPWELYHLDTDYSAAHDLAGRLPAKLQALEALFNKEAARNNAFPLNPLPASFPVGAAAGQRSFLYRAGDERIVPSLGPDFDHHAYRVTADIVVSTDGASGVIFAEGGHFGGVALSIENDHAIFEANGFGNPEGRTVSPDRLTPGRHRIVLLLTPLSPVPETQALYRSRIVPGTIDLRVDSGPEVHTRLPNAVAVRFETLDIGADLGTPVGTDYRTPARFTGTIEQVRFDQTD